MAHEVEVIEGQASVLSVRQTPWHKLGTVLPYAPSWEELWQRIPLDYEVVRKPTYLYTGYDKKTAACCYRLNETACVTVRTDTMKELGAVGPAYQVVQNRDAFAVLKPLLEQEVCSIETAGVLRDGEDAWMLVKWDLHRFPGWIQFVFGEELQPYGLISTNHSGRRGVLLGNTPVRVVCANTLGIAEQDGVGQTMTVRHTSGALATLKEAADSLFTQVVMRYRIAAYQYKALKKEVLNAADFDALILDVVSPDPRRKPRWNPEAKMAKAVLERYDRRVELVTHLWTNGAGHDGSPSAWNGYNAAVEAIDHSPELWPTRSGILQTERLLIGELGRMKTRVLQGLVEYCQEGRN